ncbi:ThiS family protein [Rubripirellula lacrimiformis]|uniref:Molybdopterin synthase sulfur carrier subunit n=1 Tax=Rubripirellula lacrimiformis TaxID=1930273 RepID=A0A517NJA7_9BACT|nr:MoaD/ThiS family protein [Rubripirellula lacrimiformis]QDT07222.1 ThiS family protein [Rubripirellula lacrimiformis]
MIKVQVQMFAGAKQIAGCDVVEIEVRQPIQAHAVFDALGRTVPALHSLIPSCRLAVDNRYVVDQAIIDDDSVIALIPPVSGG